MDAFTNKPIAEFDDLDEALVFARESCRAGFYIENSDGDAVEISTQSRERAA